VCRGRFKDVLEETVSSLWVSVNKAESTVRTLAAWSAVWRLRAAALASLSVSRTEAMACAAPPACSSSHLSSSRRPSRPSLPRKRV